MGKGDIMDDFTDDQILINFIDYIGKSTPPDQITTIVLNGDIFDFLKMDFNGEYPRYITEDISLWKLHQLIKAHAKIFEALKNFLTKKNCRVFFVIGNHDFDLAWPALQTELRAIFENSEQVEFGFSFDHHSMHIEHGHQFDPFYQHKPHRMITTYKGQKILNLPMGSYVVFDYLIPIKKTFAKVEQLYPDAEALKRHPEYKKAIRKLIFRKGIKGILIDPLLHLFNPTYKFGVWAAIKHISRYGLDFVDEERFIPPRLQTIVKKYPRKELFVLGHTHVPMDMRYKKKRFLLTDTWRDEYNLLLEGTPKKAKTYVEIHYKDGILKNAELKTFRSEGRGIHVAQ